MNRSSVAITVVLWLVTGSARADSDVVKTCIAAWVASCTQDCMTPRCVSNCTAQAHAKCAVDVAAPQQVFSGPVVATPTDQCAVTGALTCAAPLLSDPASGSAPCSIVGGAVANRDFWGGQVTVYVICPAGTPSGNPGPATTTTIIGTGASSCADGTFSFVASNACGGQTGCYGLIAAAPPASCEACGTCGAATAPGDPGWNTCTSSCCPNP